MTSDPIESLRSALGRYAARVSLRVSRLAGDEAACAQVLHEEIAQSVAELKRLDPATLTALGELLDATD